jgi:uncharacterized protein with von Willebrand factor type A (vWA) domain
MSTVVTDFIRALREADVRVSPSEAIDAGTTLALLGYDDRALLRESLSLTLAKSVPEKSAFDETFDRFFKFDLFNEPAGAESSGAEESPPPQPGAEDSPASLLDVLDRGDRAELQMRLARAAQDAKLDDIRLFTQRGMYTLRIMRAMGVDALDQAIAQAGGGGGAAEGSGGTARAESLEAARETLRLEVRDYVERRLSLFAGRAGKRLREEVLTTVRLANVDRSDLPLMRDLVRRMARKLVALHSRRRKVARRGQLDVRRTIRANVATDGILFDTIWKTRRIDRPKIFVLCDVSGSVATFSTFLLMFLHSLHEILPQVRSFAFSGMLGEVTDLFEALTLEEAMVRTVERYGGASDYGEAFEKFAALALADIDHRSTVLILGDARNNNREPRVDILRQMQDRARRVIFLNPESRSRWNTGDSVMRAYASACERTLVCASLRDLEAVVTDLVRTAI